MEKEIKKIDHKCENIREEIKNEQFHIKSKSGLLDNVMLDSDAVEEYIRIKSQELSDFKNELLKEFNGNKTEFEKKIDERIENFISEMAYLIMIN